MILIHVIDRRGTNSVKYDLSEKVFGHSDILPMWVADMDFPVADFILEAIAERIKHPLLGYTFRSESFSSAVTSWMQSRHDWKVETDSVCFSPGIVPALNMCVMEFSEPGDRIVVQAPVYFPFFTAVTNHGRELVYNQLVKRKGSMRWILTIWKQNSGKESSVFSLSSRTIRWVGCGQGQSLRRLANLCLKYKVMVISDEIHSDLLLFGNQHIPFASLGKEVADLTLTCMAPSKTFNLAGLYTSVLIATHPGLRKRYEKILDVVHVGGDNILDRWPLKRPTHTVTTGSDQLIAYLEKNYHAFV